jgi:hypothetical protein
MYWKDKVDDMAKEPGTQPSTEESTFLPGVLEQSSRADVAPVQVPQNGLPAASPGRCPQELFQLSAAIESCVLCAQTLLLCAVGLCAALDELTRRLAKNSLAAVEST